MKYIVILGDGMADEPIAALGGETPLERAATPVMDELAAKGELGMVQNVPDGMAPGSDVAIMSIFGCDPCQYFTGRSPLEAAGCGVALLATAHAQSVAALRHRALYRALLDEHIFRRAVCITRSGGERVYTVEDLT